MMFTKRPKEILKKPYKVYYAINSMVSTRIRQNVKGYDCYDMPGGSVADTTTFYYTNYVKISSPLLRLKR